MVGRVAGRGTAGHRDPDVVDVLARVRVEPAERVVEGVPELLSSSEFHIVDAGVTQRLVDVVRITAVHEHDQRGMAIPEGVVPTQCPERPPFGLDQRQFVVVHRGQPPTTRRDA